VFEIEKSLIYFNILNGFVTFFQSNAGFVALRHQANRKLSKWQLVAKRELKQLFIFKMAAVYIFPLPPLTNRN